MLKESQVIRMKDKIKRFSRILEGSAKEKKRITRMLKREFPGTRQTSIYSEESEKAISLWLKFDDIFEEELQ